MKRCRKCGLEKEPFEFYRREASSDGLSYICSDCSDAAGARWRAKHGKGPREHYSYDTVDPELPTCGLAKSERVDLGLAVAACHAQRGREMTLDEIALWCGCTREAIRLIEFRALGKLRRQMPAEVRDELLTTLQRGPAALATYSLPRFRRLNAQQPTED
jgi:hypothetical protein